MSQRSSGSTFQYNFKNNATIPTEWTDISVIESNVVNIGIEFPYTRFWPGTKYIRPSWNNNVNECANTTVDYKDIYIREVVE